MNENPRTIGVLIATYRRPDDLVRCLSALKKQTLLPDDIIVVARDNDLDTKSRLSGYPPDGSSYPGDLHRYTRFRGCA